MTVSGSGSSIGGTLVITTTVDGTVSRAQIEKQALDCWRELVGNPAADLPWNTAVQIYATSFGTDCSKEVTITIRWER